MGSSRATKGTAVCLWGGTGQVPAVLAFQPRQSLCCAVLRACTATEAFATEAFTRTHMKAEPMTRMMPMTR